MTSLQCASSTDLDLRCFLLAGTLKNSSSTATSVPGGQPAGDTESIRPPVSRTSVPSSVPCSRVLITILDTDAIEDKASPLNPYVESLSRSSIAAILLVACLSKAARASSLDIPAPSSLTSIDRLPPSSTETVTAVAPASSAFSTSSLTTDAGLSTTSPAAILLMVASSRTVILPVSIT